jgi:RNA polymerase-interacting CarD/CdnL/TRCF family regulator
MDDADRSLPKWPANGLADYRVCTECRDDKEYREHYLPDVWYTWHKPEQDMSEKAVLKTAAGFMRQYGDRIRQITYPAYSVNISDIQRDLDELAWADGFRPDVVLVDYADIVDAEVRTSSEREHLNQVWKAMKRAAGEMQALWVTASQTNRQALDKALVGQKDVAEDIRKLAHVDAMYAINQTANEKNDLITRITNLAHRHHKFGRGQVAVLHQLDIGMPYIDSEWWQ